MAAAAPSFWRQLDLLYKLGSDPLICSIGGGIYILR
jgi:hypothetical protein